MRSCLRIVSLVVGIVLASGCGKSGNRADNEGGGDQPTKPAEKVYVTNSLGMKLVLIPKGKFLMGSAKDSDGHKDNERQHEAEITRPFYLAIHEVTQKQFQEVMGSNPSYMSPAGKGSVRVEGIDTATLPVESVTWDEAVEFCKKLSDREAEKQADRVYGLPTEAEWEYACRAGTKYPFHVGYGLKPDQANFNNNLRRSREVGSYKANAFGLHDMHGNVLEWVADWYGVYPADPVKDPKGPDTGRFRVIRGGGWRQTPDFCRSAYRVGYTPNSRLVDVGFRVKMLAGDKEQ
jgi:formylglycine-generating enzyme required for sulfatase activity